MNEVKNSGAVASSIFDLLYTRIGADIQTLEMDRKMPRYVLLKNREEMMMLLVLSSVNKGD
jgi:hypothetical protein